MKHTNIARRRLLFRLYGWRKRTEHELAALSLRKQTGAGGPLTLQEERHGAELAAQWEAIKDEIRVLKNHRLENDELNEAPARDSWL
jgi:hypothetical protein